MNILFVHYLENIGGGERYLINLINALPNNYNIFLLTPGENTEIENKIQRPITKISKKFVRNFGPFPFFSFSLYSKIKELIKKENIEIIHMNDHYLLPSLLFFKQKVIFTSHGLWDIHFMINRIILRILNPIILTATPIQYFRLKNIVNNIYLLPFFNFNEVDYRKKVLDLNINLGIVGRFSPVKNHLFAFDILNSLDSSYKLHVYGDKTLNIKEESNEYASKIINKIKENGNIIHYGITSNIDDIYNTFDVLIITSNTESFSMVTIEALSYGIPVISTITEGSLSLIIDGYNGFVCNDKEDFINKIEIIRKNYDFYSKNSYKSSKKYNKEFYMKKIVEIYEN